MELAGRYVKVGSAIALKQQIIDIKTNVAATHSFLILMLQSLENFHFRIKYSGVHIKSQAKTKGKLNPLFEGKPK